MIRRSLLALTMAAVALSGCALMGGGKPATLYRFGQDTAAQPAVDAPAGGVPVLLIRGSFPREASGDRILTVTGERTAFIAETRWVAAAPVLFQQAVVAGFDADTGPARLVARGEPASAAYVLRLDVRNFEAQYNSGAKAPPEVVVRVRAALARDRQATPASEQLFEARVRASDNRVRAIVAAYDTAVSDVVGKIVAWTNGQAVPVA